MPGPVDALHLLRDRELVAYACDPSRNQAWARADARTKDPYDKRVIDRLREGQRGDVLVDEVQRLLALPTPELERVLREEPVRLSTQKKAGHKPRIVAIPSFMRRCMSYVIYRVLSLTSARVYTPIALAYRPGRPQPVQQAIRLVSRAVADGKVRFWAKLDFKGFFNAVPWWAIERSLRRLGHPESFVQTVMVLVRCRVVEVKRGRWDDHDVQQGAQQGLPESAVLANLVAHELDEQLLDLGPELTALRYSDDIFLGTPTHQPVRKAVGVVRSWAARLGILLKDERPGKPEGGVVSQDMALKQLVFDIRERPIHLLGAQIDHLGRVQPAKDRLTSKMEALTGISTKVQHAGVIQGVGLYGDGRGVKVYDQDDLERQVEGFLTYWRDLLDEGNALRLERYMRDKFLDSVREETTSRSQATTWAASLWSPQTDGKPVSGPTGASAMEVSPSQEGEGRAVQQSPGASSSPPAGPGPLTGQGQGGRGAGEGILQLEEEEPGSEPTGAVQGAVQGREAGTRPWNVLGGCLPLP